MNIRLEGFLRSLPRLLVVKTDEEARLIEEIHHSIDKQDDLQVWNPAFGLMSSDAYIDEWSQLNHPIDTDTVSVNKALVQMYKTRAAQSTGENSLYYIMLDADRYLKDDHIQRRLRNIAISSSQNDVVTRSVILVSQSGRIPPGLDSFAVFHDFDSPTDDLIRQVLESAEAEIRAFKPDFTLPSNREGDEIPHEFVEVCRGLTVFQIKETVIHFAVANQMVVTTDDMRDYRKTVIQKSNLLELMETDLTFDDVAGLEQLKDHLVKVRSAFTKEGKDYGVPASRGLLQVGVPGCGKSLIAKALSNEMGVTFVKFDPSNLFSSRVGDSERNMRVALRHIEAVAPAVVFIDEIEKGMAGIQSSSYSDSGTTARVIGTFLSWFQDHSEDIFVVATANGVDSLPPELISRFEEKFFVGLPAREAREACFNIQLQKYWADTMGNRDDIDLGALAAASESLTGREIEQVVGEGIREAFLADDQILTTDILLKVIENKPPLILTMQENIQELLQWVGYDPQRREGIRAKFASKEGIVEADISGVNLGADSGGSSRLNNLFGAKDTDAENLN